MGTANFDDATVIAKIREYTVFLQSHVTRKELNTVNMFLAKMDIIPSLQQTARQMNTVVQQHTSHREALEAKTTQYREQLQKRRIDITTCDKKLVELETFKVDIEKKIVALDEQSQT